MTSHEVATTSVDRQRKFRNEIPKSHKVSLDTRLQWLWHQRFGTVQQVWLDSEDVLDKTAATMLIQAIMGRDLSNIALVFQRLEGGALVDIVIAEDVMTI
jgi:hypothetical protein